MEKYYNDAIIGNKNMLASYTKKGELIRLFYPNIDYRQFIEFFNMGIKVNDSGFISLGNDVNNAYRQEYVRDTNILNTEIENTYFKLNIIQTDFVCIKENLLVRRYKFSNKNNINLDIDLLAYSKLNSNQNNDVSGYFTEETLIQYMHDYSFCVFSKMKPSNIQINSCLEDIPTGVIGGKDYIGMSQDSAISYDVGTLKPEEEKTIDIYIYLSENADTNNINKVLEEVDRIKRIDIEKEYINTKKYWKKYLEEHMSMELKKGNKVDEKIEQIYKRTILLYPLLINSKTGGISSGVEIDENRTKCGRYSYCWPRDSIFITKAFDILKMEKETEKFYKTFCKNTQSKNGMWEQRFYTDGNLAPCWGYQIDETASVVYGVYEHYENTMDIKFLKENLKMCEKAVEFLKKYIDDVLEKKEEFTPSYDIWEENEGIHSYSLATIFGSFEALIKMYDCVTPEFSNNRLKLESMRKEKEILEKYLLNIKEYITKNLYSEERKSFIRNKNDEKTDISLLGLTTPFSVFSPKEKKMINTIERINLTLRTYTGGYLRYEGDNYAGGNPWVISGLWLAQYYIDIGEKKKAKEQFEFVVKTASEHGFLGEQINNKTLKPAWVIGLGWSHAMFIIILKQLMN